MTLTGRDLKCLLLYDLTLYCYWKVGVWLLTTQKWINRPINRKGKFALFQMPAAGGRGTSVQRPTPPMIISRQEFFIDRQRGLHAESIQSALTVIFKLVMGGLTRVILVVLGAVNLQFRVSLFPFLWGQFLELRQLMLWASQVVLVVKNLLVSAGDLRDMGSVPGSGRSPGGGMATGSSIPAWEIPWTEEQSVGSQRVGCNWSDLACMHMLLLLSGHHVVKFFHLVRFQYL